MLDLAINLRHRLFTAHSEDRVAETDENADESYRVWKRCVLQPAERIIGVDNIRKMRQRRQVCASYRNRVDAPRDHQHDHYGRDVHDTERFLTRFRDALNVLPPEIDRDQYGKERGCRVDGKQNVEMEIGEDFIQQSDQIQTGRHPADGSGENVVEHESGDGKLRQG